MRWQGETDYQRYQKKRDWHTVFAWTPKQMDSGEWVWLERYEQRQSRRYATWQYRIPE